MPKTTTKDYQVWGCKIGIKGHPSLPPNADEPMRLAVEKAYKELTGTDAQFTFSGWGEELSPGEILVVEENPSKVYVIGATSRGGIG